MKKIILILGTVALAQFATGCATTKKQSAKSGEKEVASGDQKFRPSAAVAETQNGKPVDKATAAFQAEMDTIADDAKHGGIDYGDVASRMEDVTKKHPGYGPAWFNLGFAYQQSGKLDAAEKAYHRAEQCSPPVHQATENLAAIAAQKGDHEGAIQIMKELIVRDPGASMARVMIGQQNLAKGDVKSAEKLAKQALARDPKNVAAYCVLAHSAVQKKDLRRARLVAAQGFKIDADAPCLHHVLGLVALAENETAVALISFERAASKDPKLLDARFRIAQISMGYKDFKKAITNYAAVTETDPKNPAAYVNLGVALKGSGNYGEAEKSYLKAIEVAGTNGAPEAHFNLGVLYMKNLNRREDAKTQLKRYLQLADAGSDDPAFGMLEEIDKLKAMEEESKRQEEEMAKQEALEKKIAEEDAKKKADEEAASAAEKKRQEEIEKKMKAAGEPVDKTDETPPVDEKKDEKKDEKPKAKTAQPVKKKVEKSDKAPPQEPAEKKKDFE